MLIPVADVITIYPPDLKTSIGLKVSQVGELDADREYISLKQGIMWNRGLW